MSSNKDSDDGDDDYMSDAFLQQSDAKKESTLLFSRKEMYKHKLYKKKVETQRKSRKDLAQIEEEKRQEALNKPIASGNKGFILLEKMMSKHSAEKDAEQKEEEAPQTKSLDTLMQERKPIEIDLRVGRSGIGHEKPKRKIESVYEDIAVISEEDFLRNKRTKTELFYAKKDFFSCQRSCCTLDQAQGLEEPKEKWFWAPEHLPTEEEIPEEETSAQSNEDEPQEKEEEEVDYCEQLKVLNNYLRCEYFYCTWCGIKFESVDDLEQNCPGPTREDHND